MSDNKREDPIEEFFRKKVWDYDISYNEADWMELKDRLDVMDRQYVRRNRRRWVAAASILLFCLLGYFTFQNYSQINELSRQLNEEAVRQNAQPEIAEESAPPAPASADEGRSGDAADRVVDSRDAETPGASGLAEEQSQESSGQEQNEDTGIRDAGEGDIASNDMLVTGSSRNQLFVPELSSLQTTVSGMEDNGAPPALSHLIAAEAQAGSGTPILASGNEPVSPAASQRRPSQRPASRFSVGLALSPDLSTAGSLSDFYDPGYKIGLDLEYNLTRNLSITAGVMQSKVRYLAQASDYSPPQGYWSNGIIPSETVGECFLIDIPVSLKYNFMNFDRSRFFATAGLTSYIMQNEDYRFSYDRDYPGQTQSWSEKTGTRHWISNANFSIGYEFDLRSNWSLRAEPFLKVPLKEVGWGNVKLYSMGSFVSINYKI